MAKEEINKELKSILDKVFRYDIELGVYYHALTMTVVLDKDSEWIKYDELISIINNLIKKNND